ncbi:uncharacterized protein LOC133711384 [Rosa rugosa]|uniref:uncharacterized protein LOC133711384 n=1 Tax=Rosa rugosa TaxID=74645 RepID=UPI002B409844|nr:uncharacterized protein LOC133711384 [Rosa rugosa]
MSHLFLECEIAAEQWVWLFSMFRLQPPHTMLIHEAFQEPLLTSMNHSSQLLWSIAVCNLLWTLWTTRNKVRFDGFAFQLTLFKQKFLLSLRESAGLAFKAISAMRSSSLPIFNHLGLSPLQPTAPTFTPVLWKAPPTHWVKVNTDGSFHDAEHAGFGGIFRSDEADFLGAFCNKAQVTSAIETEILAVIEALQVAKSKGWDFLWLETDSLLIVHYFKHHEAVPWRYRVRWLNCIHLAKQMHVHVSHIFREGNCVADKLANHGALHGGPFWWSSLPQFLHNSFGHDFSGRSNYRFR